VFYDWTELDCSGLSGQWWSLIIMMRLIFCHRRRFAELLSHSGGRDRRKAEIDFRTSLYPARDYWSMTAKVVLEIAAASDRRHRRHLVFHQEDGKGL